MIGSYGLPWDTNRVEGCECPCRTCIDAVGYDPTLYCPWCPIDHLRKETT